MLAVENPVRNHLLFLVLVLSLAPRLPAQVPDPGAIQDREAEREKVAKAADQLDNIQANSEATKAAVDAMKGNVSALQINLNQLQADNAALKQQLADLQTAFEAYKADQVKSRQVLIDNVADMIAAQKSPGTKSVKKKPADDSSPKPEPTATTSAPKLDPALAPPPDASQPAPKSTTADATTVAADPAPTPTPPSVPRKGYYHVVASGETLTMIVAAYRDNGVRVTVAQIRKANGLTEDSELKTGQKLFIPKPGT